MTGQRRLVGVLALLAGMLHVLEHSDVEQPDRPGH